VEGRGKRIAKPAGRFIAASPDHTFAALSRGIDIAFARWDLSHGHVFELPGAVNVGVIDEESDDDILDGVQTRLSRLKPGDLFTYTFDFGDVWFHTCQLEKRLIDPVDILVMVPDNPTPYFGWGSIPDQYGRTTADD
jgi:hypothetical protein